MAPSIAPSEHSNGHFAEMKRRYFFTDYLDTDQDGIVRWCDLELLLETVELLSRNDEFIRSKLSLIGIWHDLTDRLPNQDEMTMDEWLGLFSGNHREEEAMMEHFFNLFDPSGDQLMDESEYIHVLGFFGKEKSESIQCFDRLGRSPTGDPVYSIDTKRFACLWKDFFYSDLPNADGSYLFGFLPGLEQYHKSPQSS